MTILLSNPEFTTLASDEQIERTVAALERNGFRVLIAEDGATAKRHVLDALPAGSEVFTAQSRTLDDTGIAAALNESGQFNALRPRFMAMDWATQASDMRKLGGGPDHIVGSVHAITEDGRVLVASGSGSQLGAYAFGAGKVVWVVGAQKIVPTVDDGLRRLQEHSLPLETERLEHQPRPEQVVPKVLLVNQEMQAGRITIIIVKEHLGF